MSIIEFLSQPIWQRFGLTLVHFLWQGLVIAVLVSAFIRTFRLKHGNARYTAYLLAKQGLDVMICEKNAAVGKDVNCTGIISAECMKRFNLVTHTVDKPVHTIKAFAPSGNSVHYRSEKPFAYTVNRSNFDRELNSLARQKGAKILGELL